jgi:CheY-like chemotaxis protein
MQASSKITCIIDDDEIYLFTVKRVLEMHKLSDTVLEFRNGQDAIDFFSKHQHNQKALPDVILLDINMPVMNGWEFIEEFRKLQPVIAKPMNLYVVSSSVNSSDIDKAKSYPNVDDYLVKPISHAQLKEIFHIIPA